MSSSINYNLFLDDVRFPKDAVIYALEKPLSQISGIGNPNWIIVRSYDEFIDKIETLGAPLAVSFDCDLCLEHMKHFVGVTMKSGIYDYKNFKTKCGIDCAEYLRDKLIEENNTSIKVFVHSANPVGTRIIRDIMSSWLTS